MPVSARSDMRQNTEVQTIKDRAGFRRLPLTANEFVMLKARSLWLIGTNYSNVQKGIDNALRAGEFELAALQARFSLQLGIRIKLAGEGHAMDGVGGPFEALASYAGKESDFYRAITALDRENPLDADEVRRYCTKCRDFITRHCGLAEMEAFLRVESDDDVKILLRRMRELSDMASYLGAPVTWPQSDLSLVEAMAASLARVFEHATPS
jgi:hypothetical protein